MKFGFEKKGTRRYLSFLLCICCAFCLFLLLRSLLPHAISYSVSTDNANNAQFANAVSGKTSDDCLYECVSDIDTDGPFTIKSKGEEIHILCDGERLYLVKAKLSDFPKTDRQAIEKGIDAKDKAELFEIVSYMES